MSTAWWCWRKNQGPRFDPIVGFPWTECQNEAYYSGVHLKETYRQLIKHDLLRWHQLLFADTLCGLIHLLFWHGNRVFIGLALQFPRLGPQWEHSMEHGPCSAARSSAAGGKTVWHTADIGGNWCHPQSERDYLLINSSVYAPLILCRSVKDNAPCLWLPRGSLHTIVTGSPHKKHFTRRRKLTALL